jgi:hypothetical protein
MSAELVAIWNAGLIGPALLVCIPLGMLGLFIVFALMWRAAVRSIEERDQWEQ